MKKSGLIIGAAAIAVLAGCKDPKYLSSNPTDSTGDVKNAGAETTPEQQPEQVQPVQPAEKEEPVVVEKIESEKQPVAEEKNPEEKAPEAKLAPAEEEKTAYIVQRGDYLSKISRKYNIRIDAIKRVNPNMKGDVIRVGQTIWLPGKVAVGEQKKPTAEKAPAAKKTSSAQPYKGETEVYKVKSGDTLGAIAHKRGITVAQLKQLNNLDNDKIRIDQKLKVPVKGAAAAKSESPKKAEKAPAQKPAEKKEPVAEKKATQVAPAEKAAESAETAPAAEASVTTAPVAPVPEATAPAADGSTTYVVRENDDIFEISLNTGVSSALIMEANNINEGTKLQPGQVLKIPSTATGDDER